MTSNERNYSSNGLCLTVEFLPCLDINYCMNWGGGLPPLKVTTNSRMIHAMSKRTNGYTVPELDTQAKKVINKRDASSVIIELILEALSYILAEELLSHSATQVPKKNMPGVPWWWWDFLDLRPSQGTT